MQTPVTCEFPVIFFEHRLIGAFTCGNGGFQNRYE